MIFSENRYPLFGIMLWLIQFSSEEMMRLIAIPVLAVALTTPSLAAAQSSRSAGAPVGRRPPNAQDVPQDQANPQANPSVAVSKEDRALDHALKGICRGC